MLLSIHSLLMEDFVFADHFATDGQQHRSSNSAFLLIDFGDVFQLFMLLLVAFQIFTDGFVHLRKNISPKIPVLN